MNKKSCTCKACGAEIRTGAKFCQHCGAKNEKPIYKKWWFWLIVLAVIGSIGSAGDDKTSENTPTTPPTTQTATIETTEATTGNPSIKSDNITIAFTYGERSGMYIGFVDENGLPDGTGTFESVNSEGVKWTYSGDWKHGHLDGHGITKWETGETYCGEYVNDEASGYGVLFDSTGAVLAGNFENGHLNGYGSVYLGDDVVFWGNYNDGNAESGKVYLSDGSVVDGSHINNNISYTTIAAESTHEVPTEATIETTEATENNDEFTTDYVLNTNSRKFHYPSCSSAKQIKNSNKAYFTGTRDEVIKKGYSPCGRCCP